MTSFTGLADQICANVLQPPLGDHSAPELSGTFSDSLCNLGRNRSACKDCVGYSLHIVFSGVNGIDTHI